MKHKQTSVQLDFVDFDIGHRGGQYRSAIHLSTDVSEVPLHHFAVNPMVFDFGQIYRIPFLDPANKAHSVCNIHYNSWHATASIGLAMRFGPAGSAFHINSR